MGKAKWGRLGESAWCTSSEPKSPSPLWTQGLKLLPLLLTPPPSLCNFNADLVPKIHVVFSPSPLLVSLKIIKPNPNYVASLHPRSSERSG